MNTNENTIRAINRSRSSLDFGSRLFALVAGIAAAVLASPVAAADESTRYSYFRVVEGEASVRASASGSENEAESNYPILVGDRLTTFADTRFDALLSDGTQVSMAGEGELVFQGIAHSPDGSDEVTHLELLYGDVYLSVYGSGDELGIVDTVNSRFYLQESGTYVIRTDGRSVSEVLVREGFVEAVSRDGSAIARDGELLIVDGDPRPTIEVVSAPPASELETWAGYQEQTYTRASATVLDEPLAETAGLDRYGDWVDVEGTSAWRPKATYGWRPYWRGRWTHTPGGLYWVSYDAWSPVVYHYGSWDNHPYYGWVWYPGRYFAPAHVYWYWGPEYAGWVPYGYYRNRYRRAGFGYRFGVWGYAGGSWDLFGDWVFCPTRYFGYRNPYRYYDFGSRLRYRHRLDRGYITTDTRRLGRDVWHDHGSVRRILEDDWKRDRGPRSGGQIADVTPFFDRGREVSDEVGRAVLTQGRAPAAAGWSPPLG